jgi:hypothetical protein
MDHEPPMRRHGMPAYFLGRPSSVYLRHFERRARPATAPAPIRGSDEVLGDVLSLTAAA